MLKSKIYRFWVQFFRMFLIRINDLRSLGSWCINGANESSLDKDSPVLVPFKHQDTIDLGSLILNRIITKERTSYFVPFFRSMYGIVPLIPG